jgi:hypothetical protein
LTHQGREIAFKSSCLPAALSMLPGVITTILFTKSMNSLCQCAGLVIRKLLRGQTNFLRMLWKFNSVYNPELQLADHRQPVKYEINLPPPSVATVQHRRLYIHENRGRDGRQIDHRTEEFVNVTRMGTAN